MATGRRQIWSAESGISRNFEHAKEKAIKFSLDSLYFMPATTHSPTHFRRAVQSALRGLTFGA
jgi:hypothetical protein